MCFRYFDFKSFRDIDRLTIPEVNIMREALQYRLLDRQDDIHKIAYLTNVAGATKSVGKRLIPVYAKYEDFFNYEEELKKVAPKDAKTVERYKKISEIVKKREKKAGKGGNKNE